MTRSRRASTGSGKTTAPPFNYDPDLAMIDFRANPEFYRIGKGEQGVLLVEPYKSELLPHWRFKTPELARDSADMIYRMFLDKARGDFVGMDMARTSERFSYGSATLRWRPLVRGLDASGPSPAPWQPPVSLVA